jgi:hypothetical protein
MENITDLFDMEKYTEDDVILQLNQKSNDEKLEYVKILEKMYYTCKSSSICRLLKRLLLDDTLEMSVILRLQIIYLFENEVDDTMATKVYQLLVEPSKELEITCQFEVLKFMFTYYPQYIEKFFDVLKTILFKRELDEDYRYRSMLESKKILQNKTYYTKILKVCFESDAFCTRNKMLQAQYMINHPLDFDPEMFPLQIVYDYLMSVLMDEEMCYENRVDVADIILNLDDMDEEWKNLAIHVIDECGRETNQFSFYHNQENVHYVDTSSIQNILEYLNHTYTPQYCGVSTFCEKVRTEISNMQLYKSMEEEEKKRIHVALMRIQNDRSCYGVQRNSLYDIMLMVLSHIRHHKYREELQKRLFEELVEMSGKCATGYVIRLVNVLSGFDDKFFVRIPPEESMKSVLFHKLNEKMFQIQDEEEKNEVLYEITLPSSFPHLRRNFLKFFRDVFPNLKDEMYQKFKEEMSDTDFDLYLRRIVINYEGYEAI